MEPRSYIPLAGIPEEWLSARGSATGVSSRPVSYGEWGFTAMAGNRAVSSHLDRVGLARVGVTGTTIMRMGPKTSWSEVDEAEHYAGRSELSPCPVVVTLGKCPERSRSNAPSLAATTSGR